MIYPIAGLRYLLESVSFTDLDVHQSDQYNLQFMKNHEIGPIHYNCNKDLGLANMIINC